MWVFIFLFNEKRYLNQDEKINSIYLENNERGKL